MESQKQKQFEQALKDKLEMKSGGAVSEETVLLKAFKYFDLDQSGSCSPDEFKKALEKIGVAMTSP